jgi:hypothetical protein
MFQEVQDLVSVFRDVGFKYQNQITSNIANKVFLNEEANC